MPHSNKMPLFRQKSLDLSNPAVMGILNVTPDSFSDGGLFIHPDKAVKRIAGMRHEGASIIDVGGESTRPGSDPVSVKEEIGRTLPVLEKAIPAFPDLLFSIDTTKYEVAEAALEAGAHIVNDVSGLRKEPRLANLCGRYSAGLVIMHSLKNPKTMQDNPWYDDVIGDIIAFFKKQLTLIEDKESVSVILDPGIGFGKTVEHNLKIINKLGGFHELGYPLLVGASRKSVIGHILGGRETGGRLAGTIAMHYHALINGASLLRVHDVKEAVDAIKVFCAIRDSGENSGLE